jgi:uncharacterized protein (TIGR02145 family)
MKKLVLLSSFMIVFSITFGQDTTNTVTDIEGNVYHTVKIGTQTWMIENLKVTRYTNGESIPNVTSAQQWNGFVNGAYCWYNNDIFFKDVYGALYNFYAIDGGNRQLAPKGWHIPSLEEWKILFDYLGGEKIAGNKLKESGLSHWVLSNDATNESGFNALPGGCRVEPALSTNAAYFNVGSLCVFWTSTNKNIFKSYYVQFNSQPGASILTVNTCAGLSIRCIKD